MNEALLSTGLDRLFEREIEKKALAGASIAVNKGGRRVFTRHYGCDNKDTIYRIFSMSKPIASAAAFILYERGLIDLWQPISDFLPSFAKMRILDENGEREAKTPITVQMLLNMRSGLVYGGEDGRPAEREMARVSKKIIEKAKSDESFTTALGADMLAEAPLLFEPDSSFNYGASADVLGGIIEVASGMSPGEFMYENIFAPLGMVDTGFSLPEEKLPRLSKMYTITGGLRELELEGKLALLMSAQASAERFQPCGAGLYSTLEDYSRFAEMLLGGGTLDGVRVLGRKTVEFMRSSQLTPETRKDFGFTSLVGYDYSNFFRILTDKGRAMSNGSIGEFGWDGLPGCYFLVDPSEQLTLCYIQQNIEGPSWEVRRKYRQIVYSCLK